MCPHTHTNIVHCCSSVAGKTRDGCHLLHRRFHPEFGGDNHPSHPPPPGHPDPALHPVWSNPPVGHSRGHPLFPHHLQQLPRSLRPANSREDEVEDRECCVDDFGDLWVLCSSFYGTVCSVQTRCLHTVTTGRTAVWLSLHSLPYSFSRIKYKILFT